MGPNHGFHSRTQALWFLALSLSLLTVGCGGGSGGSGGGGGGGGGTPPEVYTRAGTNIQITFESGGTLDTSFSSNDVSSIDSALSVIPAAQLEHIDWLAAESSDAPSTGQGIIFNLLPLGLRPPDEAGVMDTLFEGIGQNVYQNVLSPAEQTEWQTLDSATSPTQAQLDFVSLYDFWLPESDKAFEGNLNEALVGPNPNSLFFQEVLFFVATLFVNPDKTMNFYRTNAVVSPVAVTVTAVTVTRTTTGFSLPAVGSALPATQYTLSGDGTTITSVTWVSQTYAVDIPIPQPFVTYLDSLPISGP